MNRIGIAFALAVLLFPVDVTAGNKKPNKNGPKKQQQDVQQAKSKTQKETREVQELNEQLAKLRNTAARTAREIAELRKKLDDEYESSDFFVSTRKRVDEAKQGYQKFSDPLLKRVREGDEHRDLIRQRDQLKEQLNGAGQGPSKESLPASIAELTRRLRVLEQEVVAQNPEATKAKEELELCEARMRELKGKQDETVEKDRRITLAKESLAKTQREIESAEAKLAREVQQAEAAAQRQQQEEQQRRAAAERQKQQKNKKNKK